MRSAAAQSAQHLPGGFGLDHHAKVLVEREEVISLVGLLPKVLRRFRRFCVTHALPSGHKGAYQPNQVVAICVRVICRVELRDHLPVTYRKSGCAQLWTK